MRSIKDIIARRRPGPDSMPPPMMLEPTPDAAPAETPEDVLNGKTMVDIDLESARGAVNFVPKPERPACKDQPDWTLQADEMEFTPRSKPRQPQVVPAPEPELAPLEADASVPTPIPTPTATLKAAPPAAPKIWNAPEASAPFVPQERPPSRPIEQVQAMPAAPARPAIPTPESVPTPQPARRASSERVKTRMLGFHADAGEANVFAGTPAEASTAIPMFPIGWLVVVDGPGRGASYTLATGLSTIGRDADQTVSLDFGDTSISRERHASVAYDEEDKCVYVGHGGKSNIVRHNGKPLLTTEELSHGDTLKIGKTSLRYVAFCSPEFAWDDSVETQADPHA